MKELPVIAVPFYEFEADQTLVNSVLDDIKNLEFVKTEHRLNKVSTDEYYHPELFDFFDDCLLKVRDKFLVTSLELPIVACWVNKSTKLQAHHYHNHAHSFITGVFYLTTHDKSETIFTMPNPWGSQVGSEMFIFNEGFSGIMTGKVKPTKGKLILFPSKIMHKVSPNLDNETRYTISFNTFFSGKVAALSESVAERLEIKPTSVRDRIKNSKGVEE